MYGYYSALHFFLVWTRPGQWRYHTLYPCYDYFGLSIVLLTNQRYRGMVVLIKVEAAVDWATPPSHFYPCLSSFTKYLSNLTGSIICGSLFTLLWLVYRNTLSSLISLCTRSCGCIVVCWRQVSNGSRSQESMKRCFERESALKKI